MMPKMNGFETCRKFKENEKTADIPIIFLTAKTEIDDIVEGFDAGGVDYITKPFNQKDLLVRVKNHIDLKKAKEEIIKKNEEIRIAHNQIELDLIYANKYINSIIPPPLSDSKIDVSWKFEPSEHLGGDCLGYHWLDSENFCFYILDVSGHGIKAALHSVSISNMLRYRTLPNVDFRYPENVLNKLNEIFLINDNNGLFFTIWYGVYNSNTRTLNYCSGGHPPAFLFQNSIYLNEYKTKNPLIGGIRKVAYKSDSFEVPKDSTLILYTDGAYEVELQAKEFATYYDLKDIILENIKSQNAFDYIYSKWLKKSDSKKLNDDFTMLRIDFH